MNCEEFEARGLDARHDGTLSPVELAAAREHVSFCARCAGLQDSWLAASEELRAYGEENLAMQAPARVEMRLRQEFRTQHRTRRIHRTALVAGWALAAAVVIAAATSWIAWRNTETKQEVGTQEASNQSLSNNLSAASAGVADADADSFTYLPGSFATELDDAPVFRVNMQRSALSRLGIPVNEEKADEWVQVDLLVSDDGWPQAVRLPR